MTPEPKHIIIDEVREDGLRHLKLELVDGITWWVVTDGKVAIQYTETDVSAALGDPILSAFQKNKLIHDGSLVDGGLHVSAELDSVGAAMDDCFLIDGGHCVFWGNSIIGQTIAEGIPQVMADANISRDEAIFGQERMLVRSTQARYGLNP